MNTIYSRAVAMLSVRGLKCWVRLIWGLGGQVVTGAEHSLNIVFKSACQHVLSWDNGQAVLQDMLGGIGHRADGADERSEKHCSDAAYNL